MKKCPFLVAFTIATTALLGAPHLVSAQSSESADDAILPPIVFLLLDTSGSMNYMFDESTNNTRLTNALAEIIGGSTYKVGEEIVRADCGKEWKKEGDACPITAVNDGRSFDMPYPEMDMNTGLDKKSGGTKTIPINSKIARPKDLKNAEASFDQNGIIQQYEKLVKFGFAGLAVGSGGSTGKDSAIQKAATAAGGRTQNTDLRFTLIWGNDKKDDESTSDLDSHLLIFNSSGKLRDRIYYSHKTALGGHLDVDNTWPKDKTGEYAVCINRTTEYIDKCTTMEKDGNDYERIGVENIYWDRGTLVKNLQEGDTLHYIAQPFAMRGDGEHGFQLEISYSDEYGCPITYTYTFKKDIPYGSHSNDYNYGYPAVTLTFHKKDGHFYFDITPDPESPDFKDPNYVYKDKSTYDGYTNYGNKHFGSNGGFKPNEDFTLELSAAAGSPDYIYGLNTISAGTGADEIVYGKKIPDDYKQKPRECTFDIGIWDMSKEAGAPLVYPTASDDEIDIQKNNKRLIQVVRTYTATAATPIGEALADIYHMFGGKKNPSTSDLDQGLTKYRDSEGRVHQDDKFSCTGRKKSVILISDGIPNGSGLTGTEPGTTSGQEHGFSVAIWNDTKALYSDLNMKVFVIGYSEVFKNVRFDVKTGSDGKLYVDETPYENSDDKNVEKQNGAYILSKAAWMGGTCRNEEGNIIEPGDTNEQQFLQFLKDYDDGKHQKLCFFNALDQNSLRVAIVNALSESTGGTVSKTPVVTTTATGFATSTVDGEYSNGFYNIYSGYKTYLGNKRDSFLERAVFICRKPGASGDGYRFEVDKNNRVTNLARRHDCQIQNCLMEIDDKLEEERRSEAHEKGEPDPIPLDKTTGFSESELESIPCAKNALNETGNTCLNSRVIFSGNYSQKRNTLYPENAKLHDGKTDEKSYTVDIGFIKDGNGKGKDTHYLTQNNADACKNALNGTGDYMISPYECHSEIDCQFDNDKTYLCEAGRCVEKGFGGTLKGTKACTSHSGCEFGQEVCHNGTCVAGIVKDCDIRSYIATQRLGTIEYAKPTVVEPPNRAYKNAEYKLFQQKYWNRDTMLLVGANDGMLHSFILGDNGAAKGYSSGLYAIDSDLLPSGGIRSEMKFQEGDELWGFIPKAIMPKVRNLISSGQQSNVNAAPTVADVLAPKEYHDISKDNYTSGSTTFPINWRTVAVGGFRDGARGYYALDITNPAQPRVLWEIDPHWKATSDSNAITTSLNTYSDKLSPDEFKANLNKKKTPSEYYPFLQLGQTYAQPIVTNVLIYNEEKNITESVPVAILSGGLSNNQAKVSDSEKIDNFIGRAMYIVRLFPDPNKPEDLVIKTFYFKNEITGAPAVYPNGFSLPTQFVYFGDNTGAVYRLNLNSPKVELWGSQDTIDIPGVSNARFEKPVFDPANFAEETGTSFFEQITQKPAVSLYKMAGNLPVLKIAIGTGSNDNISANEDAENYVGIFYDVPVDYSSGIYTFNPPSYKNKSMLLLFNSKVTDNKDVSYKSSDTEHDKEQAFKIYVKDPADHGVALSKRQKMTGAPLIYNYDVYFPTYIGAPKTADDKSVCSQGNAAIYIVRDNDQKYGTIDGNIQNKNRDKLQSTTSLPENASSNNDKFMEKKLSFLTLATGTKIYGLQITNQLYCGNGKDGTFAVPQLIAQTSGAPGVSAVDNSQKGNLSSSVDLNSFTLNLESIRATTRPVKWATVYE